MVKLSHSSTASSQSAARDGKQQRNWYKDRYQRVLVQRNILAVVTLVALLSALSSSFAISNLAPLKSVEPFVIQVEDKTGVTQVVDPIKAKELTSDEAVNRYFAIRYLTARENFDVRSLPEYMNIVRIMSTRDVYYSYRDLMDPKKPESRYAQLGMSGTRSVAIKSISPLPSNEKDKTIRTAQARIQVTEKSQYGEAKVTSQIVTMSFQYVKLPLKADERDINPLGFQIVSYRVDNEALTQ